MSPPNPSTLGARPSCLLARRRRGGVWSIVVYAACMGVAVIGSIVIMIANGTRLERAGGPKALPQRPIESQAAKALRKAPRPSRIGFSGINYTPLGYYRPDQPSEQAEWYKDVKSQAYLAPIAIRIARKTIDDLNRGEITEDMAREVLNRCAGEQQTWAYLANQLKKDSPSNSILLDALGRSRGNKQVEIVQRKLASEGIVATPEQLDRIGIVRETNLPKDLERATRNSASAANADNRVTISVRGPNGSKDFLPKDWVSIAIKNYDEGAVPIMTLMLAAVETGNSQLVDQMAERIHKTPPEDLRKRTDELRRMADVLAKVEHAKLREILYQRLASFDNPEITLTQSALVSSTTIRSLVSAMKDDNAILANWVVDDSPLGKLARSSLKECAVWSQPVMNKLIVSLVSDDQAVAEIADTFLRGTMLTAQVRTQLTSTMSNAALPKAVSPMRLSAYCEILGKQAVAETAPIATNQAIRIATSSFESHHGMKTARQLLRPLLRRMPVHTVQSLAKHPFSTERKMLQRLLEVTESQQDFDIATAAALTLKPQLLDDPDVARAIQQNAGPTTYRQSAVVTSLYAERAELSEDAKKRLEAFAKKSEGSLP